MSDNNKTAEERKPRKNKAGGEPGKRKNLTFFTEIADRLGLSLVEMSKNAGKTSQNLYTILKTDDASLITVTQLLGCSGYLLIPGFEDENKPPKPKTNYVIQFDEDIEPAASDRKNRFDNLQTIAKSDNKLAFLAKFILEMMADTGISLGTFCEKSGVSYTLLRNNFISDDTKVSTLYKISEAFGIKVIWSVKKVNPVDFKEDYKEWEKRKRRQQ